MEILFRIVKAFVMAIIMAGSVWVLTGSVRIALVAALIPFVLGLTNIMTAIAYGLTAIVFLVAVTVRVVGEDALNDLRVKAEELLDDAKIERLRSKPLEKTQ